MGNKTKKQSDYEKTKHLSEIYQKSNIDKPFSEFCKDQGIKRGRPKKNINI